MRCPRCGSARLTGLKRATIDGKHRLLRQCQESDCRELTDDPEAEARRRLTERGKLQPA